MKTLINIEKGPWKKDLVDRELIMQIVIVWPLIVIIYSYFVTLSIKSLMAEPMTVLASSGR